MHDHGDVITVDEVDLRDPIVLHNRDIDHLVEEHTHITGVSNLSRNCTCGITTGTPRDRGASTVVCTVTTRHLSLKNNGNHQLVQQLQLWDLDGLPNSNTVGTMSPKHNREVQHFVKELNPGTSKEIGSRLSQAVRDDSFA